MTGFWNTVFSPTLLIGFRSVKKTLFILMGTDSNTVLTNSCFCIFVTIVLSGCGGRADNTETPSPTPQACQNETIPSTPLRRLTRFEYTNSVRDLLSLNTEALQSAVHTIVQTIPADETDGFDNNAALQVAPELLIEKYVLASEALAAVAVTDIQTLNACNVQATGESPCARQFMQSFGRRAFRRPLTANDESQFMLAYDIGSRGGSYSEGLEMMISMALQMSRIHI